MLRRVDGRCQSKRLVGCADSIDCADLRPIGNGCLYGQGNIQLCDCFAGIGESRVEANARQPSLISQETQGTFRFESIERSETAMPENTVIDLSHHNGRI